MKDNLLAIKADRIITPNEQISAGIIITEDHVIHSIGSDTEIQIPQGIKLIDASDKIVVPGFIDTHIHGRDGHLLGEDPESTAQICETNASTGTTSLLPTLGSWSGIERMLTDIRTVRKVMKMGANGAEILGIHMEGPYLSGQYIAKGSQPVESLRKPSLTELEEMGKASEGTIMKMTIAPELEGAMEVIKEMVNLGIVAFAGHTTASYETMTQAVDVGLNSCCHTFNGMIPFHHRNVGVIGAVLTSEDINAELIADCQHVYPIAMQVLYICKGAGKMHLVTDNTYWAGLEDGAYDWSEGRTVVKEEDRAYVEGGTLAGNIASMNYDVGNMVRHVGCSLPEAIQMASLTPAKLIGVEDRKGSLEPGKDADLAIIDDEVNVYLTMVRGRVVYADSSSWHTH